MADHNLTPEEASRLLATVHAAATPAADELLAGARAKLELRAGETPIPTAPYVGLVVVNNGGVPEVVAGEVALVDFDDLGDEGSAVEAIELDDLAQRLDRDVGEQAAATIEDLRELAHSDRVERFERDGTVDCCNVAQLTAVLAAADVAPEDVTVEAASHARAAA
jgi:hypothetical protein